MNWGKNIKEYVDKSKSGFGLWYRSHKTITIEKNGSYRHFNLKVIIMNYLKWVLIICAIGLYPIVYKLGQWVVITQFRLFCFG